MPLLPPDAIEFIGFAAPRYVSETHPPDGPAIDRDYLRLLAQAHEWGGFDRILVAFYADAPDALLLSAQIAAVTERIGLMIAHRTGFTAPTVAARQFATLDQLTGGRVALHAISGGDDRDLARDGDHLTKDERYARTGEFLDIARRVWSAAEPFDYAGRHYRIAGGFSEVKPVHPDGIPVYFGGASPAALEIAGRHADTYALWGETLAQVRELIARVRAAAAPHGRRPRFSLSFRPILAETEAAAWARAEAILARTRALRAARGLGPAARPENEGSRRLLEAAAQGSRLDKRLYTAIAAETGASGNSTALVGTPEQVAEALLDYHDLGVRTFLIRGFDPLEDALDYGRTLIPAFKALLARRGATADAA
ncbi:LLM class flavin-dependent oxidoreductase [Methylobacterium organophilum]|uniref:Methanesulfonate monooxygenase n=1 Tax=Methylobacterium organophilum TaxID=410 RepID=A0ABQ4T6A0_METOR|nr:LLM class flavin-dependent oxidoreductase [Methylobacterium organophilum]UMY17131.1 LLM class flavin-dependent oxidoreductase [Methylobacterium organophilum]GJE26848.1 Methanesulfonate monooxygenase [Methylobacterium organophilum]